MTLPYSASPTLDRLYDFQRATVEHAFRRLYEDADSTRRFLIADETGLGKTHVAAGIIAKTIERLQEIDEIKRIDIVYVCSNQDIAEQNLRKLLVTPKDKVNPAARLTLLVAYSDLLEASALAGTKPVTMVAFTPTTSFEFGWQSGRADERAIICCLLAEHLALKGAAKTSLKRILQGNVASLRNFEWYIDNLLERTGNRWEDGIRRAFLTSFDTSVARQRLEALLTETHGRSLNQAERDRSREISGDLRRLLAQASIQALEPDLVILDEFQRFRNLLTSETPAGELAGQLFAQPDARVLLLSATPYKPFTYAEEVAGGEDHYEDFRRTLAFLANGTPISNQVSSGLAEMRHGALTGEPVLAAKNLVESQLRRVMCRTERPQVGADGMLADHTCTADDVRAADLTDYVALHRLAASLDAPLTVEYWKSAPYFGNFLAGYIAGEKLKEALKDPEQRIALLPVIGELRRLEAKRVETFEHLDWGNARLRRLASETVEAGWWRLLWVPPSLPYHQLGGPYASAGLRGMTKRVIFSSWVAAPTAIASLLSYEVERQIHAAAGRTENTPEARRTIASRLAYRLDAERPASMTALALFWPSPTIAQATDPLLAAQEVPNEIRAVESLMGWAKHRVNPLVGPNGSSEAPASTAWHWAASLLADASATGVVGAQGLNVGAIVEALGGMDSEDAEDVTEKTALAAHVRSAAEALSGVSPRSERPPDLTDMIALLGVGAPGNIAWRALRRLLPEGHSVTEPGLWQAAAVLASGLQSLFNRPEVTLLLSQLEPEDESVYWRVVATYCVQGDLQAVLDEYLHHLAESSGYVPVNDDGLLDIAKEARRALSIRSATYLAADPAQQERESIPFLSRFALRFGNIQQELDDVRLPEVRAAFNSPFWPFVLASTSIGQEGIDLHWWCHAVVHWNLPANPVDFEQREGRINRFKGHAVRRNVAARFRQDALVSQDPDPWKFLFEAACQARSASENDLQPYWVFPGEARIQRHILSYPLSRDEVRWHELQQLLALYRLSLGQPRQEDMVALLASRGLVGNDERLTELQLDLTPPNVQISR